MPASDPRLPILSHEPPRKGLREKYGSVYYLGLGGLAVLVLLIGWFVYGMWALRDAFFSLYTLYDSSRPEAERIQAAYALSRHPGMEPKQLYSLSLSKGLPDLARYLLAEALTSAVVADDPRAYAQAVARSEGWPDWLRLLLLRPMAYAADEGAVAPAEELARLRAHADPIIALWAAYTQATAPSGDAEAARLLDLAAAADGPHRELAALLAQAIRARDPERSALLDRATRWLRFHHPQAVRIWAGWAEEGDRLVHRDPAPELQDASDGPGGTPSRPRPARGSDTSE